MGNAVQLRFDGFIHFRVRMPDAVNRRPAGTINILLAIDIMEIAALGPHDLGQGTGGMNAGGQG